MSDNRVRARAIFSEGRDTFIDDDKNNVYVISRAFTNGKSTEHSAERRPNDDSRSLARKLFRNDLISLMQMIAKAGCLMTFARNGADDRRPAMCAGI